MKDWSGWSRSFRQAWRALPAEWPAWWVTTSSPTWKVTWGEKVCPTKKWGPEKSGNGGLLWG